MSLQFERGDSTSPVGHALIYFRGNAGSILATYVSVPPISFDLTKFMPGFLAGAMQGVDLGDAMVAAPMPPVPEPVSSVDYLKLLAEHRQDDLVYAGFINSSDPMRLVQETSEAARAYGELYHPPAKDVPPPPTPISVEPSPYAGMTEDEKLRELTQLTGLLRASLESGNLDPVVERQMRDLADVMPSKYRVSDLITAAKIPGERGQKLADLHLQRSYKLFHEDYLALEGIDREIEANQA